jgi:hypothetical protein
MSRRGFVAASLAGSGVLMGLGGAMARRVQAGGAPGPRKGGTRIHTLYLGGPDPKWPSPTIDMGGECRMYEAELQRLAKIWRHRDRAWDTPVEFTGGDLLRSGADFESVRPKLTGADGLLVFSLAIPDGGLTGKVLSLDLPMVFYLPSPSTASFIAVSNAARSGKRADVVHSSDLEDIAPHIRILDAMRRLKQTKVLLLSTRKPSKLAQYNPDKMTQLFGVQFKEMNFDRLNQLTASADQREAERLTDEFLAAASDVKEPSRADMVQSHKLYLAVRQILAEEAATVMTIDCLPGFYSGQLTAYPCVAWTRLMDEGLTGVCEADAQSTMMSLILQSYTGKPGFVSDPFFDTSRNTITYAHCVAATRMDGPSGNSLPYIIRSHMEDDRGVSIQVKMPVGQVFTTAQLLNCDTVVYHTAKVVDNSDSHRGCRTKPVCKVIDPETGVELSADRLLHQWQGPWHKVSWFGDYAADLEKISRLMGFKLVREV